MSLRIGEIGVRMAVRGPQEVGEPTAQHGAAGGCGAGGLAGPTPAEREALLADCVRIVLETLQRQEAR